jgi:hypothetical protein
MRAKFNNVKLDKNVHFIPADELLMEVRNKLKSYFEDSSLDDSDMYPIIRACLSAMGGKVYPVGSKVIMIDSYKGFLPDDFHKLILALGCANSIVISTPNPNPQLHERILTKEQALEIGDSTVCESTCGTYFQVVQKFEAYEQVFQDVYPLKLSPNSNYYCTSNCWNKQIRNADEIDIKNGCIYTSFQSGSVYIEYLQKLETDDPEEKDLLVPDFAPIREWIKAACIKEGLEMLYLNGVSDLERRLQYAKNELSVKEMNAKSFVSMPEFKELYDTRRALYGRFNKFSDIVYR